MAAQLQKITPFLWFDRQAEEAVAFYVSVFRNSTLGAVTHYDRASAQASGQPEGSVMTVAFTLEGQDFVALNGGPAFHFTEAVSFVIACETQAELDHYWDRLSEGGDPQAQMCGWLKDRYGLSWQVVPSQLTVLLASTQGAAAGRLMQALMGMKKLDIATLQRAAQDDTAP